MELQAITKPRQEPAPAPKPLIITDSGANSPRSPTTQRLKLKPSPRNQQIISQHNEQQWKNNYIATDIDISLTCTSNHDGAPSEAASQNGAAANVKTTTLLDTIMSSEESKVADSSSLLSPSVNSPGASKRALTHRESSTRLECFESTPGVVGPLTHQPSLRSAHRVVLFRSSRSLVPEKERPEPSEQDAPPPSEHSDSSPFHGLYSKQLRVFFTTIGALPLLNFDGKYRGRELVSQVHLVLILTLFAINILRLWDEGADSLHWLIIAVSGFILSIAQAVFLSQGLFQRLLDYSLNVHKNFALHNKTFVHELECLDHCRLHKRISIRIGLYVIGGILVCIPLMIMQPQDRAGIWVRPAIGHEVFTVMIGFVNYFTALTFFGAVFLVSYSYSLLGYHADAVMEYLALDKDQIAQEVGENGIISVVENQGLVQRWLQFKAVIHEVHALEARIRKASLVAISLMFVCLLAVLIIPIVKKGLVDNNFVDNHTFLIIVVASVCFTEIAMSMYGAHRRMRLANKRLTAVLDFDNVSVEAPTQNDRRLQGTVPSFTSLALQSSRESSTQEDVTMAVESPQSLEKDRRVSVELLSRHLSRLQVPTVKPSVSNYWRALVQSYKLAAVCIVVYLSMTTFRLVLQFPNCLTLEPRIFRYEDETNTCPTWRKAIQVAEGAINAGLITQGPYMVTYMLRGLERVKQAEKVIFTVTAVSCTVSSFGTLTDYDILYAMAWFGGYLFNFCYLGHVLATTFHAPQIKKAFIVCAHVICLVGVVYLLILTNAFLLGSISQLFIVFFIVPTCGMLSRETLLYISLYLEGLNGIKTDYLFSIWAFVYFGVQAWQRLFLFKLDDLEAQGFAVLVYAGIEVFARGTAPLRYFINQKLVFGLSSKAAWEKVETYLNNPVRTDIIYCSIVGENVSIVVAYCVTAFIPVAYDTVPNVDNFQRNMALLCIFQLVSETASNTVAMHFETARLERHYLYRWRVQRPKFKVMIALSVLVSAIISRSFYIMSVNQVQQRS